VQLHASQPCILGLGVLADGMVRDGTFTGGDAVTVRIFDRVFVRCRKCGRIVLSRVPRDGDGTARLPYRHKTRDGKPCDGHLQEGEWLEQQEQF